jgi:hypothetical protein
MRAIAWLALLPLVLACSKENTVEIPETCSTGQYNCKGNLLQVCNAGRTGWDDLQTCAPGTCQQGQKSCGAACQCKDESICRDADGEGCSACAITNCCSYLETCRADPQCAPCLDACLDGGTATCFGTACSSVGSTYWPQVLGCVALHCKASGC